MKALFIALVLLSFSNVIWGQVDTSKIPQFVHFQATARNSTGQLLANQVIRVRFVVYDSVSTDSLWCAIYQETTNDYGEFSVQINNENTAPNPIATSCNATIGFFEDIRWEEGNKWLQIELEDTVGNGFVLVDRMQLSSAFYSLASEFAERIPHWYFEGGDTVAHNGAVNIYGNCFAFNYFTPSDERFKKDITVIPNALASLEKIRGVYYYYRKEDFPNKNFDSNRQIGLIAQELEAVYPELVTTNPDGFKAVDYSKLTAVLLQAMKEQDVLLHQLESEQNLQDKDIQQLKAEQIAISKKLQTLQATLEQNGIFPDTRAENK